ncbi:hypothetical protein SAY87_002535 [Trapa incisa]|uniref:Helicase-like transcription factor CHR28 n=1 Tax=Trapa incisa TaxID=236973 RepID=A0AAN7JUM6_9MYRT|nr:hypothetical protein SAY87_002535 [Trapa incisa]
MDQASGGMEVISPGFCDYNDFYATDDENLSIDFQSLMDILDGKPSEADQRSSEDLIAKEVFTRDSVPAVDEISNIHSPLVNGYQGSRGALLTGLEIPCTAGALIDAKISEVENCEGNNGSLMDSMSLGAHGSNSFREHQHLGVASLAGASVEPSMFHNFGTILEDHLLPCVGSHLVPFHDDSYQSFPLIANMPTSLKDERRIHTDQGSNIVYDAGIERWGSTSTSFSEILPADSGVMGNGWNEHGYHFSSMDKSDLAGPTNEELELPLSWSSLYVSTLSDTEPIVGFVDENPCISKDIKLSSSLISPLTSTHHVRVNKKMEGNDLEKPSKRVRDDAYGFMHGYSLDDINLKTEFQGQFLACAQSVFTNKSFGCIKDEGSSTSIQPNGTVGHPSNCSPESAQSNIIDCRSHVDDMSDICIIEEMSHPAPLNQFGMPSPALLNQSGKSNISYKRSMLSESQHYSGVGNSSLKTNSERQIFHVALQDLSQPKSEVFPPDGFLTVPLLRHQRIALSWMIKKETAVNCSGGILADDQGLGKTISTIALIVKERPPSIKQDQKNIKHVEPQAFNLDEDDEDKKYDHDRATIDSKIVKDSFSRIESKSGASCHVVQPRGRPAAGTLVVCPTSVLRQWADELHNKVTQTANISVLVYHGSNRTKDPFEVAKHDVVLTTYSIVSMEVPKQPLVEKEDDENRKLNDGAVSYPQLSSSKKRKHPSCLKKISKDGKELDGALPESVAAGPLSKVGWFRVVLDEAQSIKNHKTQVARACWGLRAKRRWCLSGTPIQNAIDDLYSYFRFLRYDPYDVYNTFCSNIKAPIHRSPSKGYKKLQAILKTIMLRRTKGTLLDGKPIITLPPKSVKLEKVEFSKEERDFYSKLEADSRARFEEYAAAGTVKENYVNILLMLLRLRQACDHPLLVRGYDASSTWKPSIEVAKKLPPEKKIQLLNCLGASQAICAICNDPPEEAVVSMCGHVFCSQCMCEHLTSDETDCPNSDCKIRLGRSSLFSRESLSSSLSVQLQADDLVSNSVSEAEDRDEFCKIDSPYGSTKIRAAVKVLQSLSRMHKCNSRYSPFQDTSNGTYSGKLSDIGGNSTETKNPEDNIEDLEDLRKLVAEKAIVFSQWTRMLDLLETCLKSSSIQYRRLDGTMSVIARDKAVKDFNTLPEVTVMIMSLKAASLGLNMVSACHVLLMDLWWNPTTEDQAVDRAHRIGQTRPVKVLRLTVKDTVEDRILALQQKKRVMVASAFGEDEAGSRQSRLTVDDLKYLFMA